MNGSILVAGCLPIGDRLAVGLVVFCGSSGRPAGVGWGWWLVFLARAGRSAQPWLSCERRTARFGAVFPGLFCCLCTAVDALFPGAAADVLVSVDAWRPGCRRRRLSGPVDPFAFLSPFPVLGLGLGLVLPLLFAAAFSGKGGAATDVLAGCPP